MPKLIGMAVLAMGKAMGVVGGGANPWHNWAMDPASRVQYAGPNVPFGAQSGTLDGSTTGRTLFSDCMPQRCRQNGFIRQVIASTASGGAGQIKFKVFRPVGAAFQFVAESELIAIQHGPASVYDLAQPIPCQPGDVIAMWLPGDNTWHVRRTASPVAASLFYEASDVTGEFPLGGFLADDSICMQALGVAPVLAVTGDSIMSGQGQWLNFYDTTGPDATRPITYEIPYHLRQIFGASFEYQNHSKGGEYYSWVNATGIVSALATGARDIAILAGHNDVHQDRAWGLVSAALDGIKTKFAASASAQRLFILEILPWTYVAGAGGNLGDDTRAVNLRTFNANLAAWVTTNNDIAGKSIKLIPVHNEMGVIRASTGQLDDGNPLYFSPGDGIHLIEAGAQKAAQIMARYL